MTTKENEAETVGLRTEYIVFTLGAEDVLVSVRGRYANDRLCYKDAETLRDTILSCVNGDAADKESVVRRALESAGYTDYEILHTGVVCHIEV